MEQPRDLKKLEQILKSVWSCVSPKILNNIDV